MFRCLIPLNYVGVCTCRTTDVQVYPLRALTRRSVYVIYTYCVLTSSNTHTHRERDKLDYNHKILSLEIQYCIVLCTYMHVHARTCIGRRCVV